MLERFEQNFFVYFIRCESGENPIVKLGASIDGRFIHGSIGASIRHIIVGVK
jgi:hypothetical protein